MSKWLIGFRKFALAIVFLATAVLLLVFNIIPGQDWLKHVSTVVVAFMGTNIGEHLLEAGKEYLRSKNIKAIDEVIKGVKGAE